MTCLFHLPDLGPPFAGVMISIRTVKILTITVKILTGRVSIWTGPVKMLTGPVKMVVDWLRDNDRTGEDVDLHNHNVTSLTGAMMYQFGQILDQSPHRYHDPWKGGS